MSCLFKLQKPVAVSDYVPTCKQHHTRSPGHNSIHVPSFQYLSHLLPHLWPLVRPGRLALHAPHFNASITSAMNWISFRRLFPILLNGFGRPCTICPVCAYLQLFVYSWMGTILVAVIRAFCRHISHLQHQLVRVPGMFVLRRIRSLSDIEVVWKETN